MAFGGGCQRLPAPMALSGLCPPCPWPALLRACISALPLSTAVKVSTGPAHWKSGPQGLLAEMGLRGGCVEHGRRGVAGNYPSRGRCPFLPSQNSSCKSISHIHPGVPEEPWWKWGQPSQGAKAELGGADLYHRKHLSGIQKKEMNTGRIWLCCIALRT